MKLPDVDRRIVYGILSLVAVAVLLLIPLPQRELVAYKENIPYEAVIVSEGVPGGENKVCVTALQPLAEKTCGMDNVSFSVSSVECSNVSASVATYNVHNLDVKKGRFDVIVGFSMENGKKSERSYDRVIDAKSTETFSFSISMQETTGCYIKVNNAVSELECTYRIRYSSGTTCYGGDSLPRLQEEKATLYREVERQKFVTVYRPTIIALAELAGIKTG